jgi:iron(III) transport system permease protein
LTSKNYVSGILEEPRVRQAIVNSLTYSAAAATIGVALAAVAAWVIYRSRVVGRRLLEYVCMAPLAIPASVLAVAYLWSFVRTPIYGTMWILILGYVGTFIPFGVRAILPSLSQIDPSLEESGQLCGLSWFRVFGRVVVPLIRPSLIAAWLLFFLLCIKELPLSILLYGEGTRVLSISIFDFWAEGHFNEAAAIATLQIAATTLVVTIVGWVSGSRDFTRSL